jgi:hypothetical protein
VNVEPLEPFQHFLPAILGDRKRGNGTRSKKAGEIPFSNYDRGPRTRGYGRDPCPEESRSPTGAHGGHERAGENLQESVENPVHLISRRAVEPLEAVHPHLEDPVFLRGLNDRAHVPEHLQDFLDGGRVVCGIGLEESEGGTEGEGSRNEHPRLDAGLRGPLGHLPESAASFQVSRSEERDRRRVQLRRTHQLQPELEGGEPEA